MAKVKIDTSKPIVGIGSKLDAVGAVCDVVGMTDIPVVSQCGDLVSAGISVATGDYIGAALSVGSMIPIAGKAAETAKIAHKAKKFGAVKWSDSADNFFKTGKAPSPKTAPKVPQQPTKTQAQAKSETPEKEIMERQMDNTAGRKLDIMDNGTPYCPQKFDLAEQLQKRNQHVDINAKRYRDWAGWIEMNKWRYNTVSACKKMLYP